MAFPDDPLEVTTELQIGGVWTDITDYVYTREPITITAGRSDEAQHVDPSKCTLTLDNRDGRFSDLNPMSPYYGLIGRNTPVRVSVDGGTPYLAVPGEGRASTPDAAVLDITGDLDVRIEVSLDDWDPTEAVELAGKYDSATNQRSWVWFVGGTNRELVFRWSPDGTTTIEYGSDEAIPVPASGRIALRSTLEVDNGAGASIITHYTAPSINGPWTQLGTTAAGLAGAIYSGSTPLDVGDVAGAGAGVFFAPAGRIYAFELRSGIDGTVVANPDFTAQTAGTTSFADSSGLTWTVGSGASITDRETRFHGEVSEWPVRWGLDGRDVYVPVEASGILRRLGQGAAPLQSTLRRRIPTDASLLAYWPMEDGKNATQASSPISGVQPMAVTGLDFANVDSLAGSSPLPVLASNSGAIVPRIHGLVPTSEATEWRTEFLYNMDAPPATERTFMRALTTGTVREWYMKMSSTGGTLLGLDGDGATVVSDGFSWGGIVPFGSWYRLVLTCVQNGSNVDYHLKWIEIDVSAIGISGTYAGTVGHVTAMSAPPGGYSSDLDGLAVGHISVFSDADAAIFDFADHGYTQETAGDRLTRLGSEESVAVSVYSATGEQEEMGPQTPETLLTLLRDAADADGGILYEQRERLALMYRDRSTLYNQTAGLVLDYTAEGEVGPPLVPVSDDQKLRNDVTVTRRGGSSGRAVVETGPLSILPPEEGGVGTYNETVTLNLATDEQTELIAAWRVHLGTWPGARYPSIRLMLHAAPHLITDWLAFRIGDKGKISNPPAWLPPEDIEFLGQGYTEVLDQYTWDVVINATPAGPWDVAVLDDEETRLDTAGSELTAAVGSADTTFTVLTTSGPLWVDSATYPSDFPVDLVVGGEEVTATAITAGASDSFGRTVASGWGTADVGGAWTSDGGSATNYSVASGRGVHTMTTVNVSRRSVLTAPGADVDLYADIATSALATGGFISGGIAARYTDSSNMYLARLAFNPAGTIDLAIRKRVGGTESQLTGLTLPLTHAAGTAYRLRFQVDGSTLRARAWLATSAEPGIWHLETTDTDLTAAGSIGCRSILSSANTNASPEVRYDTFTLTNPQRMTVTRAANGISKAHAAGAAISLARPTYIAL